MVYQTYSNPDNINNNFIAYVGSVKSASGPSDGYGETPTSLYRVHDGGTKATWIKPKGTKFVYFFGMGAGTGGGGGAASPTGFAAGGGAGGCNNASISVFMPSFMIPNVLYVTPADGGQGGKGGILGASGDGVSVSGARGCFGSTGYITTYPTPNITEIPTGASPSPYTDNCFLFINYDNNTGISNGGTSSTGGQGVGFGQGNSSEGQNIFYGTHTIGLVGIAGGRNAGTNGSITSDGAIPYQYLRMTKIAAGGGGASSVAYRGGYVSSLSYINYYNTYGDSNYGATSGKDGAGGCYDAGSILNGYDRIFTNNLPFIGFFGANGGGGNINGNGGNGGAGSIGSGGGGGGGAIGANGSGIKGGDGGNGGPGLFLIWSVK